MLGFQEALMCQETDLYGISICHGISGKHIKRAQADCRLTTITTAAVIETSFLIEGV